MADILVTKLREAELPARRIATNCPIRRGSTSRTSRRGPPLTWPDEAMRGQVIGNVVPHKTASACGFKRGLVARTKALLLVLALLALSVAALPAEAQAPPAGDGAAVSARTAPGTRFRDCAECPEMIVIPAGAFLMGTPAGEADRSNEEGPQQRVTVRAFALSVSPVTFAQWDACVAAGGCSGYRPGDAGWGRGTRPVIMVSWDNARAYVQWLSTRRADYRLPTEAEWKYAARAGTTTARWWGDEIGRGNANCDGCGSEWDNRMTAPVGSFRANPFGLHDMLGNVWQWVEDCGQNPLAGRPSDERAVVTGRRSPLTGQCISRKVRGGAWFTRPATVRAGASDSVFFETQNDRVGFRVARTLRP